VESAGSGIARRTRGERLVLGRRGKLLRLGCGVGGNGGGAKTGESEGDDESADDVVLHDFIAPGFFGIAKFFAGQTNWLQHKV